MRILPALTLALGLAGPAAAHHGWSGDDAEKVLNLSGVIRESGYEHPHWACWTGVIACGRLLAYL